MGFFDLNIPYNTSQSSKTLRMKLVIKVMELGYTGVAYNHTIKGVMSDRDSCSIPLLSFSSLLKLAHSLAFSVNFHRDLLGVPRDSPFRQYTRLTVCVDSPAQGLVLNSGNPILKSYDVVAVRPLSQTAFDHACERAEVDIIAIDFSEKLQFRLKSPMVKAAVKRGVYFELTYSDLIADAQLRRQMISNAKLLVDWTRGKNLILSSAAFSVNELRGPYDVANLLSLLGLSMERAKAAVSKNCRNLIAKALRKKNFYKEAIQVELVSSNENYNNNKSLSSDWLRWDPISSGEGDLQLDDLAKSFLDTKVSKTVKAIDFDAVIASMPSHGQSFLSASRVIEAPISTSVFSENHGRHDIPPETNRNPLCSIPSTNQISVCDSSQELVFPSDATKITTDEIGNNENNTKEEFRNWNNSIPMIEIEENDQQSEEYTCHCESDILLPNENSGAQSLNMEVELNRATVSDLGIDVSSGNINLPSTQVAKDTSFESSDKVIINRDATFQRSETVLGENQIIMGEGTTDMGPKDSEDTSMTESILETKDQEDASMTENILDTKYLEDASLTENILGTKYLEDASMAENILDTENLKSSLDGGKLMGSVHCTSTVTDHIISEDIKAKDISLLANEQTLHGLVMEKQECITIDADVKNIPLVDENMEEDSSVANCMPVEEITINDQVHEEADTQSNHAIMVASRSGNSRGKLKRFRHSPLYPLRRMLYFMPFKRKGKQIKKKI